VSAWPSYTRVSFKHIATSQTTLRPFVVNSTSHECNCVTLSTQSASVCTAQLPDTLQFLIHVLRTFNDQPTVIHVAYNIKASRLSIHGRHSGTPVYHVSRTNGAVCSIDTTMTEQCMRPSSYCKRRTPATFTVTVIQ